MSITSEQQILDIIKKYGDDTPYWRFVENFKNTIGFVGSEHNEEKNAALLEECARQYEYIRTAHPEYFQILTERKGDGLTVLAGIVDWAVVKDIPMMHFAGASLVKFATAVQVKREGFPIADMVSEDEEPVAPTAPAVEATDTPEIAPPKMYTLDELIERATKTYQEKLGQVIRVTEYANQSGYFQGSRDAEDGQRYDLAIVIETEERELAIEEIDEDKLPYVRATWNLKFLTGPLAEQIGFTHSLGMYADGAFTGDIMFTGKTIEDMGYSLLSHKDLVALAWRDAKALSENEVYIKACSGYFGDTDVQHYIQLEPPALVKGDPISIERFRIDSVNPDYEIRDFDIDNDVIDWNLDFTSDDPRLAPYRSMWTAPTSYYQSGRLNNNEIVVGYDPTNDLDKEPTIFAVR
jgi:hypothetical protein